MDIGNIKIFNVMQSNLNYLSSRQNVLAQNVANANTPGYEAKDIKTPDFAKVLSATGSQSLATTNDKHISSLKDSFASNTIKSESFEISPSGNTVNLEQEVMKLSKNGMEYQETTNIYRKMLEMLKTAIGNN